jgi:hypothetical protein
MQQIVTSDRGDFGAQLVEIRVFASPTGWLHVDILRFSYINLRYIPYIPLKWSVFLWKSWTSTGYFSNSTGSFVTNCWFSRIIGHKVCGPKGRVRAPFTWGPKFQVPTWRQSPNFWTQETIKIWFTFIEVRSWLFMLKRKEKLTGFVCRVGSGFLLCLTLNTKSQASHVRSVALQASLSYLGLCVNPDLHVNRNIWDCIDWPQVTWYLGLGTMCEPALKTMAKKCIGQEI